MAYVIKMLMKVSIFLYDLPSFIEKLIKYEIPVAHTEINLSSMK